MEAGFREGGGGVASPNAEHIGPYRLLSPIGAGGFGTVHIALDPEGRTVAVKIVHPHVAADSAAITRLAREVEAMRLVRGPHVAEVLDAELTGDRPYLVTRYVQGRPLDATVIDGGPFTGDDLMRLARGLAEALAAIHNAKVVHRDLKPANVIMADGEPVVIDFGIAAVLDSASAQASGAVVGTPGYLAPEVIRDGVCGPESDVFSFGATLAFAATGRQPYGTGHATAVAYRVVHEEPDLEGVPEWLEPLVRECLSRDPAARPTAAAVCARLGATVPPRPAVAESTMVAQIPPVPPAEEGIHAIPTQTVAERSAPRRPSPEEARARHVAKIRNRWVIGSGIIAALTAAAAQEHLPEVSLLALAVYICPVVADMGVAMFRKGGPQRTRVAVDLGGVVGTVALWFTLATVFSPLTLALALGTVLAVLIVIVVAS